MDLEMNSHEIADRMYQRMLTNLLAVIQRNISKKESLERNLNVYGLRVRMYA